MDKTLKVLAKAKEKGYDKECRVASDGMIHPVDYYKWMAFLRMWLRETHNLHFEVKAPDQVQREWHGHIWRIGSFGALGDAESNEDYTKFIDNLALEALKLI